MVIINATTVPLVTTVPQYLNMKMRYCADTDTEYRLLHVVYIFKWTLQSLQQRSQRTTKENLARIKA